MRHIKFIFTLMASAILLASCNMQKPATRGETFEHFYAEKPLSILVMPPVNQTTNVEAKEYFYATMHRPLANKGYYTIPPFIAAEILQMEGAYDTEIFMEQSLEAFGTVFQADLVLFPIIHKWKKIGALGEILIDLQFIFRDVNTGETVFSRYGEFRYQANTAQSGNIFVWLFSNVVSAAITDYVPVSRQCVEYLVSDLPYGKYHLEFAKDANLRVLYGEQFRMNF
ncbi:MAG: hypothetical protein EA358_02715 [Flavobacteriales bacterium]|nr:MAG: hypothetical protein EA358_02715 [Flavobacteriales bacterium]